jgi:hypothetical protein
MQVGRLVLSGAGSGGRVRSAWTTCPAAGGNAGKLALIPHTLPRRSAGGGKPQGAAGGVRVRLAGWRGDGPPRRRSVAGLRGRSATGGLRHGPHTCGWQQRGIFGNGRKPDRATPRAGRRPSGCKPLLGGTRMTVPPESAPANYVPAAAVRRRGRALSGVTGRKGRAGGRARRAVKAPGSTGRWRAGRRGWRVVGASGIPGVVVKCVDTGRNTRSEGGWLGHP